MNTRLLLTFAFVMIATTGGVEQSSSWTSIKPSVTTQAELIAAFGPPDQVVATFPWSEWSATWKKRPLSDWYVLKYQRPDSRSGLLHGPAGPADSVEVTIGGKKVIVVEWIYGGPSARAAAAVLRTDPQMDPVPREPGSYAAKDVPGGWVSAELGPGDSRVRVTLELK
jgi:hypothetical protein